LYRKFTANNIFTGDTLLPADHVLITSETGLIQDIVLLQEAGEDVEFFNGIISPGFINAHCHLELSHLKGLIPEQTGLVDFVFKIISERHFAEEEIVTAIEKAEQEMRQNGIVAVGDICNTAHTIPQKKKQQLHYHNFIEAAGFVPASASERFERANTVLAEYLSTINDQSSTVCPHAPYSVSPQLFQLINEHTANDIITIHNQETIAEEEFIKTKTGDFLKLYERLGTDISFFKPTGKSSLQSWWPYMNKNQSAILVHNVTTSAEDIDFVKLSTFNNPGRRQRESSTFFCLCPNANLYITNSLPDVNMLINKGCTIVLGTDSLASNHQLNILEEIKTLQTNFPALPLETMLQWATINGAKALQMSNQLGSFEKGKQPGIVLIEGVENLQLNNNTSAKRVL
jgi:cytosine/adenosine deaminase-related metal-dependent hydrolase